MLCGLTRANGEGLKLASAWVGCATHCYGGSKEKQQLLSVP